MRDETHEVDQLASAVEAMDREIVVALTPAQAVSVIGNLQLALRHPGNVGASAIVGRSVCETLIGSFPMQARALLDRGFHSEFDVPLAVPPAVEESDIAAVIEGIERRAGG